MTDKFSHLNETNMPKMVNVGNKNISKRKALARGEMFLGKDIIGLLIEGDLQTKKGPVFQTAIVAGIQAVKKTSELIPMCHPLFVNGIDLNIEIKDEENIVIQCSVELDGKTGVEMEALTGVSIAALTVYDMCKAVSQNMKIKEIELIEKTGGKSDLRKNQKNQ